MAVVQVGMKQDRLRAVRNGGLGLCLTALGLAAACLPAMVPPAFAQEEPAETDPRPDAIIRSGLPVPRFVTLRSGEVNVRTGPGVRYPVDWVFVRQGMPVEVTAEFDTWRRIRDWEGTQGWVHQSMLSGRRAVVVLGEIRTLRQSADSSSPALAQAEPGVMGRLLSCQDAWCLVEMQGIRGWLRRDEIWGVYPDERVED
ncbi:SH3 domain-containing protein [Indioceanicola profundi]|uniref:SH3 domain-containing protein n=1 Tax=Indioceanicola profundi TaxID=2220096 RepID=UPI001CECD8FF|nr:SH3 domain-containing protein [Indioceanicola profundi]